MSETANIARMAEILSEQLFSEFLWERIGVTNESWPCENPSSHGVKDHPTDVVFSYDEPYSQARVYINCDLKSYSDRSINSSSIRTAVESLSQQIACAEKSEVWHKRYVASTTYPVIVGLLFIYNHDDKYDRKFDKHLDSIDYSKLDIPESGRIFILGPPDIRWLNNVRYEIQNMRGQSGSDKLPPRMNCRYFYPQLVLRANIMMSKAQAATLEMLTSPWIILEYDNEKTGKREGFKIFYRKKGATEEEFIYLIDYLRHYQILDENIKIEIKLLDAVPDFAAVFQKSTMRYIKDIIVNKSKDSVLAAAISGIEISSMQQVTQVFSTLEIGMTL